MASFENAIPVLLKHEGGYVDNPADPGGATNHGVSLRFLADYPDIGDFDGDGDVDAEDIANMSVEDAKDIYKEMWWDKYKYGSILRDDIALKIFDFSVNAGSSRSHKMAQQTLNTLGLRVTVDGILGPATLGLINTFDADEEARVFLKTYRQHQAAFYQRLVNNKPSLGVFIRGWLKRVNSS